MKPQSQPKNKLKKRLIITGSVLVTLIALFFIFVVINISGSVKPIKEVADKFQPPASWQKSYEHIEPPRFICLEGACPELTRTWYLETLSYQELSALLEQTKWQYEIPPNCKELDQKSPNYVCTVDASAEKFNVYLSLSKSEENSSKLKAYLNIRPQ